MTEECASPKKVHALLLNLLFRFQQLCEKGQIDYYATGGTLLGAVRHGGFIPWDDDIDVIIRREDYERLLSFFEKNMPRGYCLVSPEKNRCYYQEYPKFCYLDENGEASEICVDIFVFDKTDIKRKFKRKIQNALKKFFYHVKRFKAKKELTGKSASAKRAAVTFIFRFLSSVMPFGFINRCLFKIMTADKNKKSGYVTNWGSCYSFEKSTFKSADVCEKSFKMPFECLEINVPTGWKTYLEITYGKDYMTIPPKEKRVFHGVDLRGTKNVNDEEIKKFLK